MPQELDELRTLAVKLYEAGQQQKRKQKYQIWGADRDRKFRDLPSESVAVWDAVAACAVGSVKAAGQWESFHPLHDSDVLNQPGTTLKDYRVGDSRSRTSYVSQRLLHVVLLTYIKHHKGEDVIGWDALADELHSAICEAIGDDEFTKWNDTTSKA